MANPAPTINQINAFNATQGTTIDFNIIGGTELIRSNRIYIYDLSDNSLICTHLYVSTESIHELPPNTDGSIVYESGKSSADFVNGAQYYAQIQTYTDTNGTQGGSGLSVAKVFWCLGNPTLTITTIPSTISTTSYNISATYTDTSASVVSNIIQQYQFNLYSATGSLLQSSGVVVGSGTQQGTSAVYDISHNFTGLNVGSSYYVTVDVTTTQGMSVNAQSNTFTVSIDTPTLGEATVVNNACDGYISVTSNLSGEYGGSGSGEIVSFETDSENVFSKLQVDLEPTQEGSGDPSPSNVRPIRGHGGVDVNVGGKNLFDANTSPSITLFTNQGDGVYYATSSQISNILKSKLWTNDGKYSGQICLSYKTKKTADSSTYPNNSSIIPKFFYTDGTTGYGTIKSGSDWVSIVTISTAGKIVDYIGWLDAYGGDMYIKDIQLELGSTATPYEPYQQPQTITQDFNVSLTPTSTDTAPYLFKAVGDVYGDRLEDKIVGGTVAWNQLVEESSGSSRGVSYSFANGIWSFSGTPIGSFFNFGSGNYKANHILLVDTTVVANPNNLNINVGVLNNTNGSVGGNLKKLQKIASTNGGYFGIAGLVADETVMDGLRIKTNCFDLTQMFGSTIADYIYSLEQSQAGAGVAWFKKLFPNDYYAYNAGELLSVEGLQSHDTVGFNQWDEEWEVGNYDTTTGEPTANNYVIRSKSSNYIKVIGGAVYRNSTVNASATIYPYFYDSTHSFISRINGVSPNNTFTIPQNACYMRFAVYSAYGTTYNHDICINLSNPSRNGEYEPYEKHSYPLDSSLTLRGIPKLDASNNLYYDGDEYTSDGKVKRKYGIVDLGTLDWAQGGSNNKTSWVPVSWRTNVKPAESIEIRANILCNKYRTDTADHVEKQVNDKTIAVNRNGWVYIYDSAYVSVTPQAFKEAMSGVMLVYELATPTTQTATPYTNPQIVSKYGTLEYVTNSIVPVGHKTTYLTRDIFGGYVDLISGKLVVDRKYVLGDTLDWAYVSSGAYFYATASDKEKGYNNVTCNIYATAQQAGVANLQNNQIVGGTNDTAVYVKDNRYTNATTFKQAMSGTGILYELAAPQTYQLTPQQVNTLVGTNNVWSKQGNIELSYHIPITNLLVKRQDVDDVSGGWLTLHSQPISQASDMDFTFIDFLNQYGKTYKYALVPLLTQTQSGVEVEVEGGYTVSDEVQSVFDGVFIADSTGSQKCKANVGYGNVDMNQVVGSITPIGAKYPIIVTNSHNQYHNGSISGTIVPDDYYFNGNLSRIDMVNKRNELEQFLTNKRVKVIKDWNGNIWLVMIVGNVSCTFNNNYGMGIVSFSTNWTEVGDPTNQQDLQATGLINVGGV